MINYDDEWDMMQTNRFSVRTKYVQLIFTIPFYTECRQMENQFMCNRF